MAITPIFPVLLLTAIARCKSEHINGFHTNNGNSGSQFGTLLKPPPPPQLASLVPVPFHLRAERAPGHGSNIGYQYQAPSPPRPPSAFNFPAPFYKQYKFNFVPPPQPFTSSPAPTVLQKVSGWLFPSQQSSYAESTAFNNNNLAQIKKDCNPCNLVPWLPVIRYNVGAKSIYQNPLSTYGPPNPTAYADALKSAQKYPQPFSSHNQDIKSSHFGAGKPHAIYGPPDQGYNTGFSGSVSSTYGPPSATYTLDTTATPTFSQPSASHNLPSSSFDLPNNSPNSQFLSTPSQELTSNFYNVPSSTYSSPSTSYGTPSPVYGPPDHSATPQYDAWTLNKELSQQSNAQYHENITPISELQPPKHKPATVFKNSYGEPITNTHMFDISYPPTATAAESSKVKTQVLPHAGNDTTTNPSFALSNPAPFTLNKGRNIHTLQPVALPNLSVSPLPPIFNARPFRPSTQISPNVAQSINLNQGAANNVHIQQSIPVAEFTHSVDYPPTIIQSPIIEISAPTVSNQTKGYRNIPNSYIVDEIRDISSQASESVPATKSISDTSFESTGPDFGNELYDSGIPLDFNRPSQIPINHRPNFADLRGLNDEDIDKYRTENNLQNIDSPLLYLKPSAPHKNHGNFVIAISSTKPENEYEIYDEIPTTTAPLTPSLTGSWEESKNHYKEVLTFNKQQDKYKPKIVQIIVPYTTGNEEQESSNDYVQMAQDWPSTPKDEYLARKVPLNTDNTQINTVTENYSTEPAMTTEEYLTTSTDIPNYDQYNDIKEPFDIIKLQHTIDDWTEQEYSKQYKAPQRTRSSEIYAKKIPDNYFTATGTVNYVTTPSYYNDDFYDHEGSSSIQYSVTDDVNNKTDKRPYKEYNVIERPKNKQHNKNEQPDDALHKLHIYTAASSFRTTSTTTTPAPWGKIQTSISPFTKEKVYVVTSKPWRESRNVSEEWYDVKSFQSNDTLSNTESSASKNLPFKSPRFLTRPSFGFTSGGKIENDQSYGFSKRWYQSINQLETTEESNSTSLYEDTLNAATANSDRD